MVWGISELKGLGDFGGFIPNKGLVGGVPELGILSPKKVWLGNPRNGVFIPKSQRGRDCFGTPRIGVLSPKQGGHAGEGFGLGNPRIGFFIPKKGLVLGIPELGLCPQESFGLGNPRSGILSQRNV